MIADNLSKVQQRINQAAHRAKRDPSQIILVGVSKKRTVEEMLAAYQAGLRHFGENRIEEMVQKIPTFLEELVSQEQPTLHFIGKLQSRKVATALKYSQYIHSIDSLKLAKRINRLAKRSNDHAIPILLECNVSGELTKSGFVVDKWHEDETIFNTFMEDVHVISALPYVKIIGLMTMAPIVANPEHARPYFCSLSELQTACAEACHGVKWQHLSMGMTDDFEVAIEEGSTMVRIGRAIFT
ncbi:MAG: YggS family pyridoxal phosphate enzyme [Anaerolineaceae bacterium 4572_78]|nr:MAG: YggS family pyridoxal phosphate enzyme [Anaerolineaceae bacterium 4572_78]